MTDLADSPLGPLAFLEGTWRGEGVGGYPGMPSFRYGQEITFAGYGKPVLAYSSRTWWLGSADGGETPGRTEGEPLAAESGFWRVQPLGVVEVMLSHPFGISEIYVGRVSGTRIDLTENVLIRTRLAREVERSTRLYGLVTDDSGGPDLAYAMDMEAEGQPLSPHLSARLQRVPELVFG